jgi:hypothetical protein
MDEQATWRSDQPIATGSHMNRQAAEASSPVDPAGGLVSPTRRITADSFRSLTARLKKPGMQPVPVSIPELKPVVAPAPTIHIPDFAPPIPAPPVIPEVAEQPVVATPLAEAAPPPEPAVLDDEMAPAAEPGWPPFADDPVTTVFVAPSEPAPLPTEPTVMPEPEVPLPEAALAPEASPASTERRAPHPFFPDLDVDPQPAGAAADAYDLSAIETEFIASHQDGLSADGFHPGFTAEPETLAPPVEETPSEEAPAPAFDPMVPAVADQELQATAAGETAAADLPPVAEIEPAPLPAMADVVAAEPDTPVDIPAVAEAPVTSEAAAAAPPAIAAEPVPEGIEVIGIGEIAKAVYMAPTPADRAAFLAEVAEMARQEAEAEKARSEQVAVEYSSPLPAHRSPLRKVKTEDDPFAKISVDAPLSLHPAEPDDDAGDLARSLLDMMLSNPSSGLPQERALAADALLKLVPRIPLKALITIVERLSIMEQPPHLLIARLINDPRIEVAGPLLELCNHIGDEILSKTIATGQISLQRLIARRRQLSTALTDQLIEFDDPSVILTLVRNSGAAFSHVAFLRLAEHAAQHHAALAPLSTRPDLPAPIAFELFWAVPAELRRYLLSRFLTDSETLTKILKITHVMQGGEQGTETHFPERERVETFVHLLEKGKMEEAADQLAELAAINPANAMRIISDRNGEPLSVVLKAIGMNRARFEQVVESLKASDFGILRTDRQTVELQNVFDSMSFNKARVLLTYWDWAILRSGPYAPHN